MGGVPVFQGRWRALEATRRDVRLSASEAGAADCGTTVAGAAAAALGLVVVADVCLASDFNSSLREVSTLVASKLPVAPKNREGTCMVAENRMLNRQQE